MIMTALLVFCLQWLSIVLARFGVPLHLRRSTLSDAVPLVVAARAGFVCSEKAHPPRCKATAMGWYGCSTMKCIRRVAAAATDHCICFVLASVDCRDRSVGHKGKFGHEFLEFEFRPDGLLRYANNSNYKRDTMIRVR